MSWLLKFTLALLLVLTQFSYAGAQTYLPLIQPHKAIPDCTEEQLQGLRDHLDTSGPIREDAPVCQLPVTVISNYDPNFMPGPALPDQDEVGAANYFFYKKLNIYRVDCGLQVPTCAANGVGFTGLRAKLSWRRMDLAANETFADRFYATWLAVGSRNSTGITCQNGIAARQHVSVGIGIGEFSSGTAYTDGGHPYATVFNNNGCYTYVYDSYTVPRSVNLTMLLDMTSKTSTTSTWNGRFWANGAWWNILPQGTILNYALPDYMMMGGELGALDNDFTPFVNGWTQVIEHIRYKWISPTGSWYAFSESGTGVPNSPCYLCGRVTLQSNSPMYSIGWDFAIHTSILWYVHQ